MANQKLSVQKYGTTHVKIRECIFDWSIENFKWHCCETGEYLASPGFTGGPDPDKESKWFLYLYPRGCGAAHKDDVSVHLVSNKNIHHFMVRVCLLDKYGNPCGEELAKERMITASEQARIFETGEQIFPCFVKRRDLFARESDLLHNGCLRVRCHIHFKSNVLHKIQEQQGKPAPPPSPFELKMMEAFGELQRSGKFSDVKLVLQDGKSFDCHRFILATNSKVFEAMFESDANKRQFEIQNVGPDVMEELLRFVYTKKVNNLAAIADRLFLEADRFQIEDLKKLCEDALVQNMNLVNVAEILQLADNTGTDSLKKVALDFVAANVKELADTEKFRTGMNNVSHLLGEMLNALTLRYK